MNVLLISMIVTTTHGVITLLVVMNVSAMLDLSSMRRIFVLISMSVSHQMIPIITVATILKEFAQIPSVPMSAFVLKVWVVMEPKLILVTRRLCVE